MTWPAFVILAFVTLQRLVELAIANRNSRHLLASGAVEYGRGHYAFIVGLHMTWLAALWWWAPGRPISLVLLAIFALLQAGRIWVIATLGPRWTTRIIVLPGAPLVTTGPYRFFSHPNYMIVTAEVALLPLVFDLVELAIAFSVVNVALLAIRVRAENRALERLVR